MICFPCPCFAAFCSYMCPFLRSALSSFRSFPWLPVLRSLRCTNCYPFSILPSQLKGKTNKIKAPCWVSLPVNCYSNCLPFVLAVWGLMAWADWVRSWLWGDGSRLALSVWVTQESLSEKVSFISLAAWGTCAIWWAQGTPLSSSCVFRQQLTCTREDFGSAVRLVLLVCVELSIGWPLPILVPE